MAKTFTIRFKRTIESVEYNDVEIQAESGLEAQIRAKEMLDNCEMPDCWSSGYCAGGEDSIESVEDEKGEDILMDCLYLEQHGVVEGDKFYTVQGFVDSDDKEDYIKLASDLTEAEMEEMPQSRLIEVLQAYPHLWDVQWVLGSVVQTLEDKLRIAREMSANLGNIRNPVTSGP
jgi:hypothetical protein